MLARGHACDADAAVTSAKTVNGHVALRARATAESLTTVNGGIHLSAAPVDGDITTVNGNIDIRGNSHVERGIHVQKVDHGLIHFDTSVPRIVIGPGATVSGELRFEREVKLYVSDRATVGHVTGATAVLFSGDSPPH